MDQYKQDITFLARWISGDLTSEELEAFKKSNDYKLYERINKVSQEFDAPSFNSESLFNKIQQKRDVRKASNKTRVIKFIPNWAYAAAASVVIALGLLYYINNLESHFQTGFSEQLAVVLPDNSKVQLNANSEIDYNSNKWDYKRLIKLKGEAFFDVEKGTSFKVKTSGGLVEVLGTEFNVISRGDYFEVRCQEGKVRVTSNSTNKEVILLPGNALRIVNSDLEKWNFNINETNWILGESIFHNTPLSQVLIALENQFQVVFDTSKIDLDDRFTGGFSHQDLNLALKTVLRPMNISYTNLEGNKIILVNSNSRD